MGTPEYIPPIIRDLSWLIPLFPLIGAAIAGFFGAKWLKGSSHVPIWCGVGLSAVISFSVLSYYLGERENHASSSHHLAVTDKDSEAIQHSLSDRLVLFKWIEAGDPSLNGKSGAPQLVHDKPNSKAYFLAEAAFFFDPLTAVMLCVVCGIGFLITVFAAGYMKGEEGYFRFFAYLGLFIFMMTCLVMGGNLIMLYLGWEGVGLCSYLLIGYYYEKPAAREAAKKAFLVNRIGDFGFGIGIMLCYLAFGTVSFFGDGVGTHTGLLELACGTNLSAFQNMALDWIPFCLMLGAFGKSAQFPLYVWLPDAMEGPTPVSALIHAATMVTAGVYMIARCGPLFVHNAYALPTVAVIGCITALLGAAIALRQFDLKKVFAYSTISQLGFMFVAVGALAPVAGVFHLVTHAFFKALLFLSAGVVMHAMGGELDMRKMSGIKKVLPHTNVLIFIGCAALAGIPGFSGFFSKDDIVGAAFRMNPVLGVLLLAAAFATAYYTFRLYFRVFQGPLVIPEPPVTEDGHGHDAHGGDDEHEHNHEPLIMLIPLAILAIGAFSAGVINFPKFESLGHFLGQSPSLVRTYEVASLHKDVNAAALGQEIASKAEGGPNYLLMAVSGVIALAGLGLAYLLHLKDRAKAEALARGMPGIVSLLDAKFWVDEIYGAFIVRPLRFLSRMLANVFDRFIVDGLVNLAGMFPQAGGVFLKLTVQRGYLQGYAAAMLFGVAIILLVIFMH